MREGHAAGAIDHPIRRPRPTDLAAHRAKFIDFYVHSVVLGDGGEMVIVTVGVYINNLTSSCAGRPLDIGSVEIGLKAEHPAAPLLLRADKTAGQPAALAYGADGGVSGATRSKIARELISAESRRTTCAKEGIESGAEVLFAPTIAALETDIDAGPVLDRRRSRW